MSADEKRIEITCRVHGAAPTRVSDLQLVRGGMASPGGIDAMPWFLEVFCSGRAAEPCVNSVGGIGEVAALIGDGVQVRTPDGMYRPGPVPTPGSPEPVSTERTPLRLGSCDPASFGISAATYESKLPKRRWSHEAKGRALYMPRTGMVLVPSEMSRGGWWTCVVMIGTEVYRPDGYSLAVAREEIEAAIDVTDLLRSALADACLEDFADQVRREPTGSFFRGLGEVTS